MWYYWICIKFSYRIVSPHDEQCSWDDILLYEILFSLLIFQLVYQLDGKCSHLNRGAWWFLSSISLVENFAFPSSIQMVNTVSRFHWIRTNLGKKNLTSMWPNMFSVELYRSRCVTLCLFMCRWVVCFWILDPKGQDKWLLWGNHVRSGQSSSMVQSPNITTARCSIIKVNFHCKIKAKKKKQRERKIFPFC